MNDALVHVCSKCGAAFPLEQLPSAAERVLVSKETHIGFGRYVHAVCPSCGHRDWANERRYFGVLGPRGFYALMATLLSAFLAGIYFIGFVGFK
jgi:DNA-directed RNA polymerase subunit RPC12/RpoP